MDLCIRDALARFRELSSACCEDLPALSRITEERCGSGEAGKR